MTQPERVRWGVLGTANIGRVAVNPAIQVSANGSLVAVASRDAYRAGAFAAAAGIPRWHPSYEALLDDPEVDAIYLPLPNSLHREWAIRAARAGKHVLCEKPLALTEAECREMEAAAAEAGTLLMEAFMYRFHPRTERVVELTRQKYLGAFRVLRGTFTFRLTRPGDIRMDPELGGGALMDVGCYCVNVARTVAGAEPVEVQARANWAASGVDAEMVGLLRFGDGAMAHFDCALTQERCESYEVQGEDGYLRVPAAFLPGTADAVIEEHRGRGARTDHVVPGADEYRLMVEHFADCILTGAPLRYPASEAALNMRTIEALYRSARVGGAAVAVGG
jgi:predicted dehydrogenase